MINLMSAITFFIIFLAVSSIDKRIIDFLKYRDKSLIHDIAFFSLCTLILAVLVTDKVTIIFSTSLLIASILSFLDIAPKKFNTLAVVLLSILITIPVVYFKIADVLVIFPIILISISSFIAHRDLLSVFLVIVSSAFIVLHSLMNNTHTGVPSIVVFSSYIAIIWSLYVYRLATYDVKKTEEEDC